MRKNLFLFLILSSLIMPAISYQTLTDVLRYELTKAPTKIYAIGTYALISFMGCLVHEFGHKIAYEKLTGNTAPLVIGYPSKPIDEYPAIFGIKIATYNPLIALNLMGVLVTDPPEGFNRILMYGAGPSTGLLFGFFLKKILVYVQPHDQIIEDACNGFLWSQVINLIPINFFLLHTDGYGIVRELAKMIFKH